ncbi:MAG: hypothetical protein WAP35_03620 [Solirubrobacterales bacterium]
MSGDLSKTQRKRAIRDVVAHLAAFPREYSALESAMRAFGDDFDLVAFKKAFDTVDDMTAYNRAQAVERALGRVQNYIAELARNGVTLAAFDRVGTSGSEAERAFEVLRNEKIIPATLCRKLRRAHNARRMIEHFYIDSAAGDVHRAAKLVHESSLQFLQHFRPWIEPLLSE